MEEQSLITALYALQLAETSRIPLNTTKLFPQFYLVGNSIWSFLFFFGIVWFSSITKNCVCMSKDSLTDRGNNYFNSKPARKWKWERTATNCWLYALSSCRQPEINSCLYWADQRASRCGEKVNTPRQEPLVYRHWNCGINLQRKWSKCTEVSKIR
jgi:hypothetical protein